MELFYGRIANELSIRESQVRRTIDLLAEGKTVPFISRYRKEQTGNLDEVVIFKIQERSRYYAELKKRKEHILSVIEQQGVLTEALRKTISETYDSNELEDIYLPYKPKQKTRATLAKERGLEPLAKKLLAGDDIEEAEVLQYFNEEWFDSTEEVLSGACDIVAEQINENASLRKQLRQLFINSGFLIVKVVKSKLNDGADKYRDYFEYRQLIKKIPSHRLLAVMRGHREKFLRYKIEPEKERALSLIQQIYVKHKKTKYLQQAVDDAYKRLLQPSLEKEVLAIFLEKAETVAIEVFAKNLEQMLLMPPLGQKRVLAIDPGFRTGCKVVCLSETGDLLHNETIYPHPPQREVKTAMRKITSLVDMYKIEAVAIGNGTAGRETELFIKKIHFPHEVKVFMVNESGASIYSASAVAREEFPDYDVTVRGAVSIGRRLMDPLGELVKIDPKSIGVGQYQYDVNQKRLKEALDNVVEMVVNRVGVNLNTASWHLLRYISGIGEVLAKNIIAYRSKHRVFNNRKQLLEVNKLGKRAFEQSAGFLRIEGGDCVLDNTAIHPETYDIVWQMAKDKNVAVSELMNNKDLLKTIDANMYVSDLFGIPTLEHILSELELPIHKKRMFVKMFEFEASVRTIDDLQEGMVLPGIVTNITQFGAFVDIGIKENGLIHISNLADGFVSNPMEVVSINQTLKVKVLSVDKERKRIQLSLKDVSQ